MSVHTRFGIALGLGVLTLVAMGCKTEDLTAMGEVGRFDKAALDMYMTDVSHPVVDVSVSTPSSYDSFYGDWEAKLDMKAEMEKEKAKRMQDPNYDPSADQFAEAFAEGMAEMMSFSLGIKEDKTFTMTMMFFPIEGHWEQRGDTLWLHPDKVMGMTKEEMQKMAGPDAKVDMKNEEPLLLKISADGSTLTAMNSKDVSGTDTLVFKRKAG
jgi:hypothetical protein